jgi:hypothetical protein
MLTFRDVVLVEMQYRLGPLGTSNQIKYFSVTTVLVQAELSMPDEADRLHKKEPQVSGFPNA